MKTTKQNLIEGFETLLKTKSFDDITITDITNYCGVARSTFYKHFTDKYDIMIYKYQTALDEIHTKQTSVNEWRENTKKGVYYLADHRDYFLKIIDYKGQNSVYDFLYKYSYQFTHRILCLNRNIKTLPDYENEALKIYLIGTSNYLLSWLKNMHIKPEVMAELLCNCMPDLLKIYFE
ncbi:MAG: TetR/AcrR family transcriptional regulator C-terminal domain-containing protein [Agathobacter sp.]|nr:TetR/AcrR family transcriptional regulator C-terminal domain-containing protein [Agathobacter sp.]